MARGSLWPNFLFPPFSPEASQRQDPQDEIINSATKNPELYPNRVDNAYRLWSSGPCRAQKVVRRAGRPFSQFRASADDKANNYKQPRSSRALPVLTCRFGSLRITCEFPLQLAPAARRLSLITDTCIYLGKRLIIEALCI